MIYCVVGRGSWSNSYIVAGERAAIIDAGDAKAVLNALSGYDIEPEYLINTHCHFDHIAGLAQVRETTGAKVAFHALDADAVEGRDAKVLSSLFWSDAPEIKVDVRLSDGDRIDLGGLVLEVVHTPGHSEGGICLYEPEGKALFSGDTVFADGVGRTDFPGGCEADLKRSLERLIELHRESGIDAVYPGHGPSGRGDDIEFIYHSYFG